MISNLFLFILAVYVTIVPIPSLEHVFVMCESQFEVVTNPGTIIISSDYPNFYQKNLDCKVTLKFQKEVSISFLDFSVAGLSNMDFSVAGHNDCFRYSDYLEVHDSNFNNKLTLDNRYSKSSLIKLLCGREVPFPMSSTGNSMTLVFHSSIGGATKRKRGFKIVACEGLSPCF